ARRKSTPLITLAEARANRTQIDWASYTPPRPTFLGRRAFKNYDLAEIARFIDWGPLFQTWDLHGGFPKILDDEIVGEEARRVYADAREMLARIVAEDWLTASGALAFYPANTVNDDVIEIYTDESRNDVLLTWRNVRQQTVKREGVD